MSFFFFKSAGSDIIALAHTALVPLKCKLLIIIPLEIGLNFSDSWVQRLRGLPIMPTYSSNGIENYRIAEKTRKENVL